jgi:serine/threonine protein kinase
MQVLPTRSLIASEALFFVPYGRAGTSYFFVSFALIGQQWEGHPVPATDQYALAIMLYEFLTGRPPFQGNREQLRYEHTSVLPAAPSTINPALSQWIDVVLLRALAKQPDERFPTISTFANVVAQALMPARPVATPVYQPVTPVVPQLRPLQQPPRRSGLSPGAIVIIVLVAILLPGFFGFLIYRVSRGSSTANTNANATASAVTASAPATATATILPATQFNGTWNNTDTATTGITRLIITNSGSTISVHAYTRCATGTGECDWGTQTGTYNGTPFIVTFKHAKLTDLLAISLKGSQLEVVDIGSNGAHTYLFNKA